MTQRDTGVGGNTTNAESADNTTITNFTGGNTRYKNAEAAGGVLSEGRFNSVTITVTGAPTNGQTFAFETPPPLSPRAEQWGSSDQAGMK